MSDRSNRSLGKKPPSDRSPGSGESLSSSETSSKTPKRDPLLAAICHDLRAPLAAVTMGANFVLQTTPEDEASGRSRRVLQAILRSCKQMERLVRDFGDLSEIESDAVFLRPGVHDVAAMLEMAAEAAGPTALVRNIEVVVERPTSPVILRCDRDRVLRAIGHLIDNALRFAPEGHAVTLRVGERYERNNGNGRHEVVIDVHDSGPGLEAETRAHLYDRTWHSKRADRVGAGLGLAIARGLVEAHLGHLDVASSPGSTTFTIVLPKDQPSGNSSPDVNASP